MNISYKTFVYDFFITPTVLRTTYYGLRCYELQYCGLQCYILRGTIDTTTVYTVLRTILRTTVIEPTKLRTMVLRCYGLRSATLRTTVYDATGYGTTNYNVTDCGTTVCDCADYGPYYDAADYKPLRLYYYTISN